MRIAFLTFEYPDARPGGVGSYVFKCARALAAAGHEPHIFTLVLPVSLSQHVPAGVHLHEVKDIAQRVEAGTLPPVLAAAAMMGTQAAYKLLVGALLCDALRSQHQATPFDIVEAAECEGLALPLLLRPIPRLPVVVQIHLGYAANAFGNSIDAEMRDDLAEALELASIVGADAVCAATQSVVDVTRRLCPFDRDVTIIPHPVEVRADNTITPSPKDGAALFVGRLHRRKGCDVLASAADIFLRRNQHATLRIAGSDTLMINGRSMLAEMVERVDPSLLSRFIYLGELSQTEVRHEISACRFQVVPSIVENFANTAVDAMAQGRLVIYAGNTGLDDVVGDAGIRVWPLTPQLLAEQMDLVWDDSDLRDEYGRRAFERVRTTFDSAAISLRRIHFFEEVIANHNADCPQQKPQWNALNGPQIRAVLAAMISQLSGTAGLQPQIATPGLLLTARLTELATTLQRLPHVWLFGAGRYTLRLLGERHRWESLGFTVAGIVDEHPRFEQAPDYLGLRVQKPAALCELIQRGLKVDAIILSTDTLAAVFRERAHCFANLGIAVLAL